MNDYEKYQRKWHKLKSSGQEPTGICLSLEDWKSFMCEWKDLGHILLLDCEEIDEKSKQIEQN